MNREQCCADAPVIEGTPKYMEHDMPELPPPMSTVEQTFKYDNTDPAGGMPVDITNLRAG